jgi:hypothetical protein
VQAFSRVETPVPGDGGEVRFVERDVVGGKQNGVLGETGLEDVDRMLCFVLWSLGSEECCELIRSAGVRKMVERAVTEGRKGFRRTGSPENKKNRSLIFRLLKQFGRPV